MLKTIRKMLNLIRESSVSHEPLLREDFEKSPLRFEYEAVLEEYRILWSELQARLGHQNQIINFAIALTAATVAFLQLSSGDRPLETSIQMLRPAYPYFSLLFSAFALMYLEHDATMAHLGIYIDTNLRPRIENILLQTGNESHIWQWGRWRAQRQFRYGLTSPFHYAMTSARYALTIGPSVGFAILFWTHRDRCQPLASYEQIIFGLVLFTIFWVLISTVYVSRLYFFRREIVETGG